MRTKNHQRNSLFDLTQTEIPEQSVAQLTKIVRGESSYQPNLDCIRARKKSFIDFSLQQPRPSGTSGRAHDNRFNTFQDRFR